MATITDLDSLFFAIFVCSHGTRTPRLIANLWLHRRADVLWRHIGSVDSSTASLLLFAGVGAGMRGLRFKCSAHIDFYFNDRFIGVYRRYKNHADSLSHIGTTLINLSVSSGSHLLLQLTSRRYVMRLYSCREHITVIFTPFLACSTFFFTDWQHYNNWSGEIICD